MTLLDLMTVRQTQYGSPTDPQLAYNTFYLIATHISQHTSQQATRNVVNRILASWSSITFSLFLSPVFVGVFFPHLQIADSFMNAAHCSKLSQVNLPAEIFVHRGLITARADARLSWAHPRQGHRTPSHPPHTDLTTAGEHWLPQPRPRPAAGCDTSLPFAGRRHVDRPATTCH